MTCDACLQNRQRSVSEEGSLVLIAYLCDCSVLTVTPRWAHHGARSQRGGRQHRACDAPLTPVKPSVKLTSAKQDYVCGPFFFKIFVTFCLPVLMYNWRERSVRLGAAVQVLNACALRCECPSVPFVSSIPVQPPLWQAAELDGMGVLSFIHPALCYLLLSA